MFLDIDGLKATNDSRGHRAGDALLKRVGGVLHTHLRSYELIIRLGGDEFLCALLDATIQNVRHRFDQITSELALEPEGGSVTVGFAELAPGDTPMALIDRADTDLIAARTRPTTNGGHSPGPSRPPRRSAPPGQALGLGSTGASAPNGRPAV